MPLARPRHIEALVLVLAVMTVPAVAGCRRRHVSAAPEGGSVAAAARESEGFESVTIDAGGRARTYLLHVPTAARARGPTALVVSLHGGGGHAASVDDQTGWAALANREGFAVAYPEGIGKSWNDGRNDTPSDAIRENVDDVGFLGAMIDDVGRHTAIDKRRVYVNGISNGAFMTARLACESAGRFAAIGLVAATMGPDVLASCRPVRRVSVIAFDGTADPIVPFEGGTVHLGGAIRGKAVAFVESVRFWTTLDGCTAPPGRRELPDIDTGDASTVHLDSYACLGGTAVDAYTVIGGGHAWPGGKQYLPRAIIGAVNRDVDATKLMWAFFAAHPGD